MIVDPVIVVAGGKAQFAVTVNNDHGDEVPALASLKKAFADEFIKRAGSPDFNGNNWVAALPPTYDPFSRPDVVAKGTRFGNTCSPLQLLY